MNERIWAEALCNTHTNKNGAQLARTFVALLTKKGEVHRLPKIIDQLKQRQSRVLGIIQGNNK